MKKCVSIKKFIAIALVGVMATTVIPGMERKVEAVNPIVQDVYTADPAPMACSDGRLYLYTSHDEDETVNDFFTMNDWKCYSTADMVNWTDHGTVLSYHEFEWAKENSSWACQCVEKDGKFYMYVPINHKNGSTAIGVAVSDSPTGPFVDPIGEPLVGPAYGYIDPTVWIDKDGQAYLYWGNPDLYCVKLNDDMISYDKELNSDGFVNGIKKWDLETKDFPELKDVTNDGGVIADGSYAEKGGEALRDAQSQFGVGIRTDNNKVRRPTLYEEGPWFYGRNEHYYMVYAANGIPERIDYSMSDNPLGPWEYKGAILEENMEDGKGTGSFTNHAGVVDYKGHSYIFYHTGKLNDGGGWHRSVAIEEICYNDDGTIDTVPMTTDGIDPVDTLNPYTRVEAETIEYSNSLKASNRDKLGKYGIEKKPVADVPTDVCITDIQNSDYVCIRNVDFGQYGAVSFTASTKADVAKDAVAGKINIYLDSPDGEQIAEYDVRGGETAESWVTHTISVDKSVVRGVHNVYMVFSGDDSSDNLFDFDYWSFTQDAVPTPKPTDAPIVTATPPTVTVAPPTVTAAPPTIMPSSTEPVRITAPSRTKVTSYKGGKKTMKLKWKKISGAAGYQVLYSTNKSFKKAVKKATTKKTSLKIKKLKSRKMYYAKVAAYVQDASGKKLYAKYSQVVKVKVK